MLLEWGSGTCTALFAAVYYKQVEVVRYLLTVPGVNVQVPWSLTGYTPLHAAVRINSSVVVTLLL